MERNQAWLARKLGVSRTAITSWITEREAAPRARLAQIAEVLGLQDKDAA